LADDVTALPVVRAALASADRLSAEMVFFFGQCRLLCKMDTAGSPLNLDTVEEDAEPAPISPVLHIRDALAGRRRDLEDNPGIGSSKGTFASGELPDNST